MKVLVTGNKGYIGSVLTDILLEKGHQVTGYDADFYQGCQLYDFARNRNINQIRKDIRDAGQEDLEDAEAVIHLAALSNDPLGELDTRLTEDVNFTATIKLAQLAKKAGVKRFIYSSSQSMYGVSDTKEELSEDSPKNPVTAYARTKWEAEQKLKDMCADDFIVICLRPSTVFGRSPMLRTDIVFNNLVASAYTTGRIEVKSDGTPWRPVVHVRDVSGAFSAALSAPAELVACQSFNVGVKNGNYAIRELAKVAQKAVPGTEVLFTGEHGSDSRTYRVSFDKILNVLQDYYKPEWDLERGAKELVEFFREVNFTEEQFRGRTCNRLLQMRYLLFAKKIDENLKWLK